MQTYKTKPRRKRYNIEDLPKGRRVLVTRIMDFLETHKMTMEEFASLPPEKTAVATLGNMRNPKYEGEIKNRTLIRVAEKIALKDNRSPKEVFLELTAGFPEGTYEYDQLENRKE